MKSPRSIPHEHTDPAFVPRYVTMWKIGNDSMLVWKDQSCLASGRCSKLAREAPHCSRHIDRRDSMPNHCVLRWWNDRSRCKRPLAVQSCIETVAEARNIREVRTNLSVTDLVGHKNHVRPELWWYLAPWMTRVESSAAGRLIALFSFWEDYLSLFGHWVPQLHEVVSCIKLKFADRLQVEAPYHPFLTSRVLRLHPFWINQEHSSGCACMAAIWQYISK